MFTEYTGLQYLLITNTTVTKRLTVTRRNVHRLHMFIEYTGLQYLLITML